MGLDVGTVRSITSVTDMFAAVDLGSNSFHLLIARAENGHLVPFERVKEKVQLARGQKGGVLAPAAIERGLDCIARFAQRLAGIAPERIRVVGTSALREAKDPAAFVGPAQRLLRCPIKILSGDEEAKLIFLGVSHTLAAEDADWLVIDIGGGSTEICLGPAFAPNSVASVALGCVSLTDQFFDTSPTTAASFLAARTAAKKRLESVCGGFVGRPRARVIGTSGTLESVCSVLSANGYTNGDITAAGLDRLEEALLDRRWVAETGAPGLAPERVDIFPAGLAVVCALFEVLALDTLEFVDASLRDGLLYDLAERRSHEDVRELTIAAWRDRFGVDEAQVRRVERTCLQLFDAARSVWQMASADRDLLRWACSLHEVGIAVSSRHHNRHGAYLVQNGDLAGFAHDGRRALSLLIRGCRGAFPVFAFAALESQAAKALRHTTILLRLAVILERSRTDVDSPRFVVNVDADRVELTLPSGWLSTHALSRQELDLERGRLAEIAIALKVVSSTPAAAT